MAILIPSQSRVSSNVGQLPVQQPLKTGADFGGDIAGAAANILGAAQQKVKAAADVARVQEADNTMSSWENGKLYGENGYLNTKGKNALEKSDDLFASYDEQASATYDSLSSPQQKAIFKRQSDDRRAMLNRTVMKHETTQANAYRDEQQTAYVANSRVTASQNYTDPAVVQNEISRQQDSVMVQSNLNGWSEDRKQLELLSASSETQKGVTQRFLSNEDYLGAQQHLEQNKDQYFPDTYDALMKQAKSGESIKKAQATKQFQSELTDYVAYKNSGGEQTKEFTESQLVSAFGEENGKRAYAEVQDANEFATAYNEVAYASPEDLNALIEGNKPASPEDFRRESGQFSTMVRAIQTRTKALADDPAAYVQKLPAISKQFADYQKTGDATGYAAASLAEQERLGVGPEMQTVLSSAQAQFVVGEYAKGGENAVQFINKTRESFGDYFQTAMKDLNRAGISQTAQVVSIMTPGNGANLLAEADQEGAKVIKETIGDDNYKTIRDSIGDELEDIRNTLSLSSNGPASYAKLKESTELLAMKYVSMGKPIGDAVPLAAQEVVNNRYEFFDGYRVPKKIGSQTIDTAKVDRGIGFMPDSVKELDLLIPNERGMPDDIAEKVYKRNLQVIPTTMNDDSGVIMMNQIGTAILDSEGNPIIYTWDDLQKKSDSVPGFFENFFGGE